MKWNRIHPFCSLNVSFCANTSRWVWFPVGSIIVRTRINIWYCMKTCFEFAVGQHQLKNKQYGSVLQSAFSVDFSEMFSFFHCFYFRIKYSSFPDRIPPRSPPPPSPLFVIPSPSHPSPPHSSSSRLLSHLPSLFHLCSPRLSSPLPGHLFIQYGSPISAGSFPREQDF